MIKATIIVGIGGAFGSMIRYMISYACTKLNSTFPWGTFIVNITGCLLIGILIGIFSRSSNFNQEWKLLLTTGFCGGFTTFSAFSLENFQLFQQGDFLVAGINIAGSIALGLFAVWVGYSIFS